MIPTTYRVTSARIGSAIVALLAVLLGAIPAVAQSQPAKRVYIVQSYEKGHVCGEPQAEGILSALSAGGWTVGRNLTVQSYYMDTYRTNAAPEAMQRVGAGSLYEQFGFTVAGVRRAYYTHPIEDALVLWREAQPDS